MASRGRLTLLRLLPVLLVTIAAGVWFHDVQEGGPYVLRNLLPPAIMLLLATGIPFPPGVYNRGRRHRLRHRLDRRPQCVM